MEKIAVGPAARHVIDINAPVAVNLDRIARVRDAHIDDLTVVILDRPRHAEIIRQIREVGAREVPIQLIQGWLKGTSPRDLERCRAPSPAPCISSFSLRK